MKINFGPSAMGTDTLCATCSHSMRRTITQGGSVTTQRMQTLCEALTGYNGFTEVRENIVSCSKYESTSFNAHEAWEIEADPATGEITISPSSASVSRMQSSRYHQRMLAVEARKKLGPWYRRLYRWARAWFPKGGDA